jgi:hypothetical protein
MFTNSTDVMVDKVFLHNRAIPAVQTWQMFSHNMCGEDRYISLRFHVIKQDWLGLFQSVCQTKTMSLMTLFSRNISLVEVHFHFRQWIFGTVMSTEYCQVCEILWFKHICFLERNGVIFICAQYLSRFKLGTSLEDTKTIMMSKNLNDYQ